MTSNKIRPTRFAHLEGHANICYTEDGRIVTGGLDGDIRIFINLDDDDCITHTIADEVHCIAFKDDCVLVGTNLNIIQSYTLDEGQPNGIITRCTAFPTHIDVSKDKKLIAVGSSDMTVKVHDSENYKDLIFSGHESSILSVALDPKRDFLATSSCDGTVRIWNFRTQTMVRSFPLFPKSNDFGLSSTLCRLSWSLDGQYLIVPVNMELKVYNRNTWKVEFTLSDPSITATASITTISPCGRYIAVGCQDGRICVWNLVKQSLIVSEKPAKVNAITGLVWHPKGKEEIAFVNKAGEFGTMEQFLQSTPPPSALSEDTGMSVELNTDVPDEALFTSDPYEDESNDNEISLAKIKSQLGFADDEEGTFLGLSKADDDKGESSSRVNTRVPIPVPTIVAPKLPEPQEPFQPGMSPENLSDRYMLWNNTGIVRQYHSEEEQSIEVEFHDSSIHHSLHLNNHVGHTMAALNSQALVLAAESQEDQLSLLAVHHFSAWDGSKEWQAEMPEGEDIVALCMGLNWLAAATDFRNLRIFSTSGVQRDVLCIPGPVVCVAGFEKNVLVVFHNGMGVSGEQSMSILILNVSGRKHIIPTPELLPLSPKSYLAWAGFTDEGTPIIMDSAGVVKLFNRTMGHSWTPIIDSRNNLKGKSDHYFILGASEMQAVIRCILCKGSRYPPVLPRPHASLLEFKVPLCDSESEKSGLEEKIIRTKILSSTADTLSTNGFDMETSKDEIYKNLKETMVKLFALACRSDRESRAVDLCELMPDSDMVQVAIRYAGKLHRMQLAERLNDVVQRKVEESMLVQQEEAEREFQFSRTMNDTEYDDARASYSLAEENESEKQQISEEDLIKTNPLLAASRKQNSERNSIDRSHLTPNTRNPFKKNTQSSGTSRGLQMLDSVKIAQKKEPETSILRPLLKKPKAKSTLTDLLKTSTLNKESGKENQSNNIESSKKEETPVNAAKPPTTIVKKTSALKLWMDDNREMVKEKFPNATETELLVKSAQIFKDVDEAIKQEYKTKAANISNSITEKPKDSNEREGKRKPEPNDYSSTTSTAVTNVEKKSRFESKLAGFAFSKNS